MKCKECQKEFSASTNTTFCCIECRNRYIAKNRKNDHSANGRLGQLKSLITQQQQKQERIKKYNENPTRCKQCGKALSYEKRTNKFCNSSCAASYNNVRKLKKQTINEINTKIVISNGIVKKKRYCLCCGKEIISSKRKYCCHECNVKHKRQVQFLEIEKLGEFPAYKGNNKYTSEVNRPLVRKYLIEKYGHKCSICGATHWLGKPILLIVDHIDGDIDNYKIENYRLVCSNCDATLPTYKNKNKGNGKRYYRRIKE